MLRKTGKGLGTYMYHTVPSGTIIIINSKDYKDFYITLSIFDEPCEYQSLGPTVPYKRSMYYNVYKRRVRYLLSS